MASFMPVIVHYAALPKAHECADICGLNRSHMGEIERGEVDVRLSTIEIIAQAFGKTVSAMFKGIAVQKP